MTAYDAQVRIARRVLHTPREQKKISRALAERFTERGCESVKAYEFDGCKVIVAREPIDGRMQWHASVQRDDRLPDLEEVVHTRAQLLPAEVTIGLILPSALDVAGLRVFQVHLHELPKGAVTW